MEEVSLKSKNLELTDIVSTPGTIASGEKMIKGLVFAGSLATSLLIANGVHEFANVISQSVDQVSSNPDLVYNIGNDGIYFAKSVALGLKIVPNVVGYGLALASLVLPNYIYNKHSK